MTQALQIHLVYGPTASGKSAYALEKALTQNGVIINADSQQLYRELRILTARPQEAEEVQVPHRLYGILSGDQPSDVARWLKLAKMEIDWAQREQKTIFVVGGTGMYLHALRHGIAHIPDVPVPVLAQAKNDLSDMGKQAFFERLQAVDPALCTIINAGDSQRMLRGYSVWLASGKPLSYWQKQGNQPPFPSAEFVHHHITLPREEIYARGNTRVHQMMEQGALEEVKQLLTYGYAESLPIMRIIGVPELRSHLRGEITWSEAISQMQQATRNYAKRQMTWFRNKI